MSYGTSDTDQAEYNFFPILFAIVFFLVLAPLVCISLGQQASMQKVPVTIEGVRTASACRALAIVERKEDAKDATRKGKSLSRWWKFRHTSRWSSGSFPMADSSRANE